MAISNFITLILLLLLFAIITESAPLEAKFHLSNARVSDDQSIDSPMNEKVQSTVNDNKIKDKNKINDGYKVNGDINDNSNNNNNNNNDSTNKDENVVVDDIIPGGRSQHRPVCKWVKKCVYGLWRVGWKFYTSYCYRRKVCTSSG